MEITFDPVKRSTNIAKHGGLDFADLQPGFFTASVVVPAKANRFLAVGRFGGDIISVVFAALGSEGISVISMRPASRKERKLL